MRRARPYRGENNGPGKDIHGELDPTPGIREQPELCAPARTYQFKVEQWDKTEDHVVWLIAISNNFLVARAAYEAAVKYNPKERWLLRDGIRVVKRYQP
jgi:hypothetical protein